MTDSDDEELLYGCLGTQFNIENDESIENKRQKLKRKAIDEEVTDAKGYAVRFHGAFTGGFSAGYFNTVGSKEGFTPQAFVSSRVENKTVSNGSTRQYRQMKPEDFMDEEDFGEHGIAPRVLQVNSNFDDGDFTRNRLKDNLGKNNIFGDDNTLKELFIGDKFTVGMKLLKKLGYLASKGIGENIDESSDESDDSDDVEVEKIQLNLKKFQYNPDELYQMRSKSDKFGIGYSGMNRDMIFNNDNKIQTDSVNFGYKNRQGIKGSAFQGVLFDDEDGDDYHDIYQSESMSKYNRTLVEVGEGNNERRNYGWTAPKSFSNALTNTNHKGCLNGFEKSSKISLMKVTVEFKPLRPSRFYIPIYPLKSKDESKQTKSKSNQCPKPKLMPERQTKWGAGNLALEMLGIGDLSKDFKSGGVSTETSDINFQMDLVKAHAINELNDKTEDFSSANVRDSAAKCGNYGFLTRRTLQWHPDKLLCKRFNVPDPYSNSTATGIVDSQSDYQQEPSNPSEDQQSLLAITSNPVEEPIEPDVPSLDLSAKPSLDLFKTIFDEPDLSFSDSEDDEQQTTHNNSSLGPPQNQKEQSSSNTISSSVGKDEPFNIVSSLSETLGFMLGNNDNTRQSDPIKDNGQNNNDAITNKSKMYCPELPPDFQEKSCTINDFSNISAVTNDIISRQIPDRRASMSVSLPVISNDKSRLEVSYVDPDYYKEKKERKSRKRKHGSKDSSTDDIKKHKKSKHKKKKKRKHEKKEKSKKKHRKRRRKSSSSTGSDNDSSDNDSSD